jgi:hypothetical protein
MSWSDFNNYVNSDLLESKNIPKDWVKNELTVSDG